jgi:hypothetical protein
MTMQSALNKEILGGLVAVAVLAGCVSPAPNLDANFGDAVNQAKAQQIINPDAPSNTDPVTGIDGQAANAIVDRYHKAYETPTEAPSGSIGSIGTGGSTLK